MAKADPNGMNNAAGIAYGELIRRQRKAKHMNQEELGALVRVGKNAVGAWEAGRSRPDDALSEKGRPGGRLQPGRPACYGYTLRCFL